MRGLVLSLLVIFTSAMVGLPSCRPLMRQEPVNEAERVVSASGLQVFATKGKERGFWSNSSGWNYVPTLPTARKKHALTYWRHETWPRGGFFSR